MQNNIQFFIFFTFSHGVLFTSLFYNFYKHLEKTKEDMESRINVLEYRILVLQKELTDTKSSVDTKFNDIYSHTFEKIQ